MLLFVDYEVPHYDLYAGSRTNFMYLEMLAGMGLEVKFLPGDFRRVEPYSSELNELGIETLDGEWYRENWKSWISENADDIEYVFFHKPGPASEFLPTIKRCTKAAIIYQCHDLHYLRLRRKAEVENDEAIFKEAKLYEKKEDYIFANSDVLLTFSELEEKLIKTKFPYKKVFTVPLFFYSELSEPDQDFSKRHDLLYVGSCSHAPNHDAITWFCKEVFPIIQEQNPEIALNVVGSDPPEDIQELNSDSIRILGRVSEDELQSLYASVRMMVVPLRFGAGVKGKIIEALSYGLPLVSTTIGLEGIKGIDQLLTAQDLPEGFASDVTCLYWDHERLQEQSRRGSEFVEVNFTVQKTAELMTSILAVAKDEAVSNLAEFLEDESPPRLIALYLPQFHPIPENDEWWGEGFTEWRNVSKAEPLFPGHYQPHVPSELGYYDLRDEEARIAQTELAKQYGIEGFCYYHYWFNGHRLLEHPLSEVLKSGKPDFPFCVCWANENWTRRWDGEENEILMRQNYSEEDDRLHIRSLLPVFEDKRYIRVNGKPFFLVYRTENMPNPARTAEIWREEARKAGVGELYLCRVESISKSDPADINFDAAVEFAPDWWNKGAQLKADPNVFSQNKGDVGEVINDNWIHSYQDLVDDMMDKEVPAYKWFRCVTPSWDNWARRKDGANIFLGSTPDKFQRWLLNMIDSSLLRLRGEERIVFVNAWNEWAEGNHLEPDQKFGRGYLEATKRALDESKLAADARRPGASETVRLGQYMQQLATENLELNRSEKSKSFIQNLELSKLQKRVTRQDQKIEEILNSTSWRATVPIRWVKQLLLDLTKRFRG